MEIVFDKLLPAPLDNNQIMPEQRAQLVPILEELLTKDVYALESDLDWVRMNKDGGFLRRLESYAFNKCFVHNPDRYAPRVPVKLTAEDKHKIGNILGVYKKENYFIDFNRDFQWTPGDFADKGSCLWHDVRKYSLHTLQHNGVFALRVFKATAKSDNRFYPGVEGIARGFVKELPANLFHQESPVYVIFNGYGGGRDTRFIADLFAGHLGWEHTVKLRPDFFGNNTTTKLFLNGYYVAVSQTPIESQLATSVIVYVFQDQPVLKDIRLRVCLCCHGKFTIEEPESTKIGGVHTKCTYHCLYCLRWHNYMDSPSPNPDILSCTGTLYDVRCAVCNQVARSQYSARVSRNDVGMICTSCVATGVGIRRCCCGVRHTLAYTEERCVNCNSRLPILVPADPTVDNAVRAIRERDARLRATRTAQQRLHAAMFIDPSPFITELRRATRDYINANVPIATGGGYIVRTPTPPIQWPGRATDTVPGPTPTEGAVNLESVQRLNQSQPSFTIPGEPEFPAFTERDPMARQTHRYFQVPGDVDRPEPEGAF